MITPTKEFLESFKSTPGAISVCEALAIAWIAQEAGTGIFLDLGSNHGKAAMSAAYGMHRAVPFFMVDPIFSKGGADAAEWGYCKEEGFTDKVRDLVFEAAGHQILPELLGTTSLEAIKMFERVTYVFIDTDQHQKELVDAEIELLKPRMGKGGIIAFHDFGNQFIAPKEAATALVESGEYEWVDIPWGEIVGYVSDNDLEKGNTSWHAQDQPFPTFVGAVRKIK